MTSSKNRFARQIGKSSVTWNRVTCGGRRATRDRDAAGPDVQRDEADGAGWGLSGGHGAPSQKTGVRARWRREQPVQRREGQPSQTSAQRGRHARLVFSGVKISRNKACRVKTRDVTWQPCGAGASDGGPVSEFRS